MKLRRRRAALIDQGDVISNYYSTERTKDRDMWEKDRKNNEEFKR